MININIKINKNIILLEASGHSLLDNKGKDLLCCAVSVLIQNWYFSELEILNKKIECKNENEKFTYILKDYNQDDKLLFKSLCYGLIKLEKQYKNNIKVEVEGDYGS